MREAVLSRAPAPSDRGIDAGKTASVNRRANREAIVRQFIRTLLLALTVTLLGDLPTDAQAQATQCSTVSGELQSACYKCQQQGMRVLTPER